MCKWTGLLLTDMWYQNWFLSLCFDVFCPLQLGGVWTLFCSQMVCMKRSKLWFPDGGSAWGLVGQTGRVSHLMNPRQSSARKHKNIYVEPCDESCSSLQVVWWEACSHRVLVSERIRDAAGTQQLHVDVSERSELDSSSGRAACLNTGVQHFYTTHFNLKASLFVLLMKVWGWKFV